MQAKKGRIPSPRWPSRLRNYQKRALDNIARYVAAGGGLSTLAALIRLPTGAGKTAIIGVATTLITKKAVLVVTPARALRKQMLNDLKENLWVNTLLVDKPTRQVLRLLPRDTKRSDWDSVLGAVLVTTDQTLSSLWQAARTDVDRDVETDVRLASAYEWLRENVGLVLVDEGHREPAETWSQAVRGLGRPVVLFSATPYRNDTRRFAVDPTYAFGASWETVANHPDHPLREVDVGDLEYESALGGGLEADAFVNCLLRQLRIITKNDPSFSIRRDGSECRTIVRCDSAAEVRAVANSLATRGQSVVQIHHRFEDRRLGDRRWEYRDVPSLEQQPQAAFWVHEDKLIEGIDDKRFRAVAFFHPPSTERSIVQQIGRIVRNPPAARSRERAYVLAHERWGLRHTWSLYQRAETWDQVPGATPMPPSVEQLVDNWLKLQAPFTYVFGRYRAVLGRHWPPGVIQAKPSPKNTQRGGTEGPGTTEMPSPPPLPDDVRVPLTARIRVARSSTLSASGLIKEHIRRLPDDNAAPMVMLYETPTQAAILYAEASASELLDAYCFGSLSLECAIAARIGDLVFWFDSRDRQPDTLAKETRALAIDKLQRLFPRAATPREATAKNTAFGDSAVRRRVVLAPDLNQVAEAASDFSFTCSTILGSVPKALSKRKLPGPRLQRYLGFSKGRITESGGARVSLPDYFSWVKDVANRVTGRERPSEFFRRYAIPVPEPVKSDTVPQHVILDVHPSQLIHDVDQNRELPIDNVLADRGVPVDSSGRAVFKDFTETAEFPVILHYNDELQRYEARGSSMDRFEIRDNRGVRPLLEAVTQEQRFRIITTEGLVFVDGHFARSRLEVTGEDGALTRLVGSAIHAIPELAYVSTEKGNIQAGGWPRNESGWPRDSLFGFLDQQLRLRRNVFTDAVEGLPWSRPTWLICDDPGTEIADFIVLSATPTPQITLVHAKVPRKASGVSATALQEVVGQAQKNASMVSEFSTARETRSSSARAKWAAQWTLSSDNGRHRRVVRNRLRLAPGKGDAAAAWSALQQIAKAPETRREVWIVCPRALAYDKLLEEVGKPKSSAQLVQLAYLLLGVRSAVGEHAASLRVFCAPTGP